MDPEKQPLSEGESTASDSVVESSPDVSAPQDMVSLHEASREEVKSALREAQERERNESSATPQEGSAPASPETAVAPQQQANTGQPAKPEIAPQRQLTPEEIQSIVAENAKLKKEGNQKELFIQHRNTELGQLRQQFERERREKAELKARLEAGLEQRALENPLQAIEDRETIRDLAKDLDTLNEKESTAQNIVDAQTFFLQQVVSDDYGIEPALNGALEALRADGIDERFVAQFKANPWGFTTPEALVQMGKRGKDIQQFKAADSDRRLLAQYVVTLEKQVQELKGKPARVLQQVQKNLNQSPAVTAASTAAPRTARTLDPAMVPNMSREDVKRALAQAMRGEGH